MTARAVSILIGVLKHGYVVFNLNRHYIRIYVYKRTGGRYEGGFLQIISKGRSNT